MITYLPLLQKQITADGFVPQVYFAWKDITIQATTGKHEGSVIDVNQTVQLHLRTSVDIFRQRKGGSRLKKTELQFLCHTHAGMKII